MRIREISIFPLIMHPLYVNNVSRRERPPFSSMVLQDRIHGNYIQDSGLVTQAFHLCFLKTQFKLILLGFLKYRKLQALYGHHEVRLLTFILCLSF